MGVGAAARTRSAISFSRTRARAASTDAACASSTASGSASTSSRSAEPPRTTIAWYDRAASAFARLDPDELDWPALLAGAGAFHTTGITPVLSDACARAAGDALAAARAAGLRTSYDVNLRRQLASPERARELLERFAPSLDLVLCSADDARALYGEADGDALRARLGVPLLVLAELDEGGRTWTAFGEDGSESVSAPLVRPVDPIGAGDAFAAGFLHRLLGGGSPAEALAYGRAAADAQAHRPRRRAAARPRGGRRRRGRARDEAAAVSGRRVVRFAGPTGRTRVGAVEGTRLLELPGSDLLELLEGDLPDAVAEHDGVDPETLELPAPLRLLAPLDPPEVWCAGVTYERSREARMDESTVAGRLRARLRRRAARSSS